jgi:glycerol kinase
VTRCVALDQSTSATKALLFSERAEPVRKESLEHAQIHPRPGEVEHDAEQIWQNTLAVLRRLLEGEASASISHLAITNQRETFVLFDRKTGEPLANAVVWQCQSGAPICEELTAAGAADEVRRITGLRLESYFTAPKLTALLRKRPDLRARVERGEALIGTIDSYLTYRLTGGEVFATDPTNACRTLLFDLEKLCFSEDLCRLFEVPLSALPEVRASTDAFGSTSPGLLPAALPIRGVLGDSQAALFAQRCYEPGSAKITLGTGSSVLLNVGSKPERSSGGLVTTLAWVIDGKPTYCFEGIISYAAATLEWLRENLGLIRSASETESLALSVPDNGGVYLVPAFAGLSAPYWSSEARAAIVGMSGHTTRAHVVRAALESVAYQLRDVLTLMKEEGSVPLVSLRCDGGATKNQWLMGFCASLLGVPLLVSDVSELSPLGSALAGWLGLGRFGSLEDIAALDLPGRWHRPSLPAEAVGPLYAGWQRAVQRVL